MNFFKRQDEARRAVAHFVQAAVRGEALGVGRSLSALAAGRVRRRKPAPHAAWRALGRRELSPGESRRLAWMGGTSLICWLTVITAGRLIAYW